MSASSGPDLRVVDDVVAAATELFLAARPRTVVLSGGGTPEAFYRALAGTPYPWDEVEAFFGDERCVAPDDPRSNLGMARRALLDHVSARAHPMDGTLCDADGYERDLRERFGRAPRFDLAVYGLGPDGHTASLFPGKPATEERDRWVVRVPGPGLEPFVPRVTMTAPVLSSAALGVFLVSGAGKREALRRLLAGEPIPAALMRPDRLVILADPAAAAAAV
jgi:6-phosphogluconolactonase